jgi:hypothetical protein
MAGAQPDLWRVRRRRVRGIHAGAFNLSLIMRKITGRGTTRGFQRRPNALTLIIQMLVCFLTEAEQLRR